MPVTGRIKPEAATPNRSQERKKEDDIQHHSGFRESCEGRPGSLEDQLFDVVEDHVAEARKGPAVGGGGAEQLGGRHGRGWGGGVGR